MSVNFSQGGIYLKIDINCYRRVLYRKHVARKWSSLLSELDSHKSHILVSLGIGGLMRLPFSISKSWSLVRRLTPLVSMKWNVKICFITEIFESARKFEIN